MEMLKAKVLLGLYFCFVILYGCKGSKKITQETIHEFTTFKNKYNKTYADDKEVTLKIIMYIFLRNHLP